MRARGFQTQDDSLGKGSALDRAGCESLKAPNYLFVTEKGANALIKQIEKPIKKQIRGM